jgi:tol-pal system beta propeller repeat protein TolB
MKTIHAPRRVSLQLFRPRGALLVLAALLTGGCSDGPTAPRASTLTVIVSTAGPDMDADGYVLSLDGGDPVTVAANGQAVFEGVEAGAHVVSLGGTAVNCTAEARHTVEIAPPDPARLTIEVECVPLVGHMRVTAPTGGSDRDAAYLLYVDGDRPRLLVAGDSVGLDLHPGEHSFRVAGIAPNCTVNGTVRRATTVEFGDSVSEEFRVLCERTTSRIAFASTRADIAGAPLDNDIFLTNPDGTNLTRLTVGKLASFPAWSPDGTRIAYQAMQSDGSYDILVIGVDGSGERRLTSDPLDDVLPQWSPDGSQIVFVRATSDHSETRIWVMNADGTGERRLLDRQGWMPAWSPDGNRIGFSGSDEDLTEQIFMVNVDGTDLVQLTSARGAFSDGPRWSPDGKQILFTSSRDGGIDVFTMRADGSDQVNLTFSRPSSWNQNPSWSPDGQFIVFMSTRQDSSPGGSQGIYVMHADGSAVTRVAPAIGFDDTPAWRPF